MNSFVTYVFLFNRGLRQKLENNISDVVFYSDRYIKSNETDVLCERT